MSTLFTLKVSVAITQSCFKSGSPVTSENFLKKDNKNFDSNDTNEFLWILSFEKQKWLNIDCQVNDIS